MISMEWLKENNACGEGVKWFEAQEEKDGVSVVKKLIIEKRFPWASWLIVRLMAHKQKVQYAVFSAEQVIDLFEKKYPDDNRPREAIKAAKAWIENPCEETKKAAADAYDAAADAYDAVYAATAAATAAADAYDAAAYSAAYAAAYAADAYDAAAADAYDAAAYSAAYADAAVRIRILDYGFELLRAEP